MSTLMFLLIPALIMVVVERIRPGTPSPAVGGWWARVLLFNGAQAAVAFIGAATWDRVMSHGGSLLGLRLEGASALIAGYLLITFVYYWWHRARHALPGFWRLHQLHHSPRRIEIATSFYKHPLEQIANGLLTSSILFLILGLSAADAATVVLITGVAELFYHWNVRTPHWLGYVFQRPEMHRAHHEFGRHTRNFSDLPCWDLLFGTWHNPRGEDIACGFTCRQEQRVTDMLLLRDVRCADAIDSRGIATFVALVVVGTIQMAGDVFGVASLKAIGAASTASPQPKVFTAQNGFETYSSRFYLRWQDEDGRLHEIPFDGARYQALAGPYNRRNAYGAAISYAPVLYQSPITRPMLLDAVHYAVCEHDLFAEVGVPASGSARGFRLEPRDQASADPRWRLDYLMDCTTGALA